MIFGTAFHRFQNRGHLARAGSRENASLSEQMIDSGERAKD